MTNPSNAPEPSPARPPIVRARRKPRYVLGTFWVVIAIICLVAGFGGYGWGFLFAILAVAYAIYLYRGGRFGFWFF